MMLTKDVTDLLDKLYNLRGEDSVVLKEMDKERETAEATKERTSTEKVTLQERISSLQAEESELAEQGSKLMNALSGINSEEFSVVLERLNIDFNPEALRTKLSEKLPETIDKVVLETQKAESELVKVEEEMNAAITTIEELGIRRDTALSNQAKLNEYFELALNGNLNITRDSITSILEQFNFSEAEQREAAKIMMFPEDALYAYNERAVNGESTGKSISEVIAEARDYTKNLAEEDIVEEPITPEIVKTEEPTVEEQAASSAKETLKSLMTEYGLDYLDFTNSDIEKIIANYTKEVFVNNVNLIKANNMDLDIFADNVQLLYDNELEGKITRLVSVGKAPLDIYLNPNVLVKYDLAGLNNAINLLQINGLDPRKVPLMAY